MHTGTRRKMILPYSIKFLKTVEKTGGLVVYCIYALEVSMYMSI